MEATKQRIEICYITRAGVHSIIRVAAGESIYNRLKLLRKRGVKDADVWTRDEYGALIERIGGIEEIEGADDGRIKYQVWAHKNELGE